MNRIGLGDMVIFMKMDNDRKGEKMDQKKNVVGSSFPCRGIGERAKFSRFPYA